MNVRPAAWHLHTITSPGFGENGYIAWAEGSATAIAIDPGAAAVDMAAVLDGAGLGLEAVLLTHAHIDHVEGITRLVRAHAAPIHMHAGDSLLYQHAPVQAQQFGVPIDELPPIDQELTDGQILQLAGLTLQVRHSPGHSPGHIILYCEEHASAFVGDVVFQGSIGRTDLPGGNYQELMASIRAQVLSLPNDTALYCGHGPNTTVGHERASNPFLIPQFGDSRFV